MWLPYFCNTANITTSSMEIHETGYAWRYIRASMTLVGLLPPLCDRGNMLVDGGYSKSVPFHACFARISSSSRQWTTYLSRLCLIWALAPCSQITLALYVHHELLSIGLLLICLQLDDNSPRNCGDSVSGWWLFINRWNPFSDARHVPAITEIQSRLA